NKRPAKIINICSMLSYQGGIRVPAYTASKSAILGLTRALCNEWAQYGITNPDGSPIPQSEMTAGLVADTKTIAKHDLQQQAEQQAEVDYDVAPTPVIHAYLTYPNFYRIKKWNNSSWYALAIAELADKLK
ncbi:MAG: SDR family NAD(P)-dependent oxidoreductase, partial [Alphaproteobacteria bacterium]|nr:SDR family NAD(P)-dependent oxidoreductase [Alphaproteobacteria bacterium]